MNVTDLKNDIDFLCKTNSNTYKNADKIRNMNVAYQNVARLIWEAAGEWQYDDSNADDFGIATTTLVDSQKDYELPTACQRVQRVEIIDGAGNYLKLRHIDTADMTLATTEHLNGTGTPLEYDLVGRSLFLYPTPGTGFVTMAAGLKVYFDRDVTELTTSDTSTSPGFATAFHRILSLAAAKDYLRNDDERKFMISEKIKLENGLKRFYGKRNIEGKTKIKPAGKKRWRQYT